MLVQSLKFSYLCCLVRKGCLVPLFWRPGACFYLSWHGYSLFFFFLRPFWFHFPVLKLCMKSKIIPKPVFNSVGRWKPRKWATLYTTGLEKGIASFMSVTPACTHWIDSSVCLFNPQSYGNCRFCRPCAGKKSPLAYFSIACSESGGKACLIRSCMVGSCVVYTWISLRLSSGALI